MPVEIDIPGKKPDKYEEAFALATGNLKQGAPNPMEHTGDISPINREIGMRLGVSPGGVKAGLDDYASRAEMSFAENFDEKAAVFKKHFPTGELKSLNTSDGPVLMYRTDPEANWGKVDANFAHGDKGEFLGDLTDFAGDTPEAAATLVAAIFSGGMSLPAQIGVQALSAGGGHLAEEGAEWLRGTQKQPIGEIAKDTALEMGVTALGDTAAIPITKAANMALKKGVLTPDPSSVRIDKLATEKGLPPLMAQQMTDNPIITRATAQTSSILPEIQTRLGEQALGAKKLFFDQVRDAIKDRGTKFSLKDELGRVTREGYEGLRGKLRTGVTLSEGGEALQKGITDWDKAARDVTDAYYNTVRGMDESPTFDISGIKEIAASIKTGTQSHGVKKAGEATFTPQARGGIWHRQPSTAAPVRVDASELPPVQNVLNDIADMDAIVRQHGDDDALTQLIQLRRRLGDAADPGPGKMTQEHLAAKRMYAEITKVMQNPSGVSPEYTAAWQKANDFAKKRFDAWDSAKLRGAAGNETPDAFLKNLIGKEVSADELRIYKASTTPEQWGKVKDATDDYLARNIESLPETLAKWDDETLKEMFTPVEMEKLRSISKDVTKFNNMKVDEVLAKQNARGAVVADLLESGNTKAINDLLKEVGGKNTQLGKELRAGYLEHLYKKAREWDGKHQDWVVDPKVLRDEITAAKESGALRFITTADLNNLKLVASYMDKATKGQDMGAVLAAQAMISDARGAILHPTQWPRVAYKFGQLIGVGRMATHPKWRDRLFKGADRPQLNDRLWMTVGGLVSQFVTDFSNEASGEASVNYVPATAEGMMKEFNR